MCPENRARRAESPRQEGLPAPAAVRQSGRREETPRRQRARADEDSVEALRLILPGKYFQPCPLAGVGIGPADEIPGLDQFVMHEAFSPITASAQSAGCNLALP